MIAGKINTRGTTLLIIAAMSKLTWIVVLGSWVLLLGLTALAYRFNRNRGDD